MTRIALIAIFAGLLMAGDPFGHPHGGGDYHGGPMSPVPEPQTWLLMAGGLVGLITLARRKRR